MTDTITRRRFLVEIGLGVGGGAVLCAIPVGCSRSDGVGIDLSLVYANPGDVIEMGRDYLDQFPTESKPDVLETSLGVANRVDDPIELRGAIAAQIRSDFDAHELFSHRGWIFARSEGRLAALAALDSGAP